MARRSSAAATTSRRPTGQAISPPSPSLGDEDFMIVDGNDGGGYDDVPMGVLSDEEEEEENVNGDHREVITVAAIKPLLVDNIAVSIMAGPGMGKSEILKQLVSDGTLSDATAALCTGDPNAKVFITSTTAASAAIIEGETFAHFEGTRTGVGSVQQLIQMVLDSEAATQRMRSAGLIVMDEACMKDGKDLDKTDQIMQAVRNCTLPFGGCHVLFVGDPLQLPPCPRNAERHQQATNRPRGEMRREVFQLPTNFLWQSAVWDRVQPVMLTLLINWRHRRDPVVSLFLDYTFHIFLVSPSLLLTQLSSLI